MNEIVERAAKAIWDSWPGGSKTAMPWPNCPEHDRCVATARAVIVAMREPNAAMLAAVFPDRPTDGPAGRPWFPQQTSWNRSELAEKWQMMIDEAMK